MARMMGEQADTLNIPLTSIDSSQLKKVIDWLESHKGNYSLAVLVSTSQSRTSGKTPYDFKLDEVTGERTWVELSAEDREMLEPMNLHEYIELLDAAHYLEVDSLRYAVSQSIAATIRDLDPDAMRAYFGEEDDLTEKEKEAIRQEDVWASY